MIMPAVNTPKMMGGSASFSLMRKAEATSAPVQPPVPGNGTATNTKSPSFLCFATDSLFALAFFSKCSTIFFSRVFFKTAKILSINSNMNGRGSRLPMTQIGKAYSQFTLSRLAAMSPPRSSRMGISDTIKIIISAGMTFVRPPVIDATKDSAKMSAPPLILRFNQTQINCILNFKRGQEV